MPNGTCSIDGCDKPTKSRGWCTAHYERWRRHGDVDIVYRSGMLPGNGMRGPKNPRWGAEPTYGSIHQRVRYARGPAGRYDCAHCGGRAEDWAYDHLDPDERRAPHRRKPDTLVPYSTNPDHYIPLCKVCHYALDRKG